MKTIGFNLTDYKIQSIGIYRSVLISFSFLLFAILFAEVFYDLKTTSLEVLIPLTAISFTIVFLSFKFPDSKVLRTGLIIMVYAMIEIHFLINPKTFHVITYWFPFIPLIALLIQGIKPSQFWIIIILASHLFNSYFLGQTVGDSYEIIILRTPFFVTGIIFALGIIASSFLLYTLLGDAYNKMKVKNKELEEVKKEIEQKKNLLESYQRDLIDLSKNESLFSKGQDQLFKVICKTAVTTLKVNRVSIWLFENQNSCIVRKFLYELDNATDEVFVLERKDFQAYFKAIETKPFIMASKAREHPETRDFTEGYLKPLDIYSMLDCPIVLDRKPIGVICCENQHEVKIWNTEDALFIQSLADFISSSYKNERIKNLLTEVRQKNFELVGKNNEIGTMNEELNAMNEELSTMNESLEETVRYRTSELETQNTQLTEYAFINSHLLRAPLSRILGLSYLLTKEATSIKDSQLLDALVTSTNEMDSIIRKISDILYDGNNLTREDIKSIIDRNLNKDQ
jgi:hypothetical protein